jgi:hypothetical protein
MTTSYSERQLKQLAAAIDNLRPPEMTAEEFRNADQIISFAWHATEAGVVFRMLTEKHDVRDLTLNPLVAQHLRVNIANAAKAVAWTIEGEPFDSMERCSPGANYSHARTEQEDQWINSCALDSPDEPDRAAFDRAPRVVAVNGNALLGELAVSLAIICAPTVHLRMNRVVAWEIWDVIFFMAKELSWWNTHGAMLPGAGFNYWLRQSSQSIVGCEIGCGLP